ncbi:hypothetical protein DQW77_04385 [Roseovarius sp. TE539]|uniref:hypothetical protein n=1 Tax=Roseovarius sp. TE539 TaxID=2249812 RepID=UPI000DDD0932|nr:hypothetical protein [Roseovarius sp. TE539]RBI76127.1 hypothetical protein DQW77_04385 [Roseovarius sp. TE539]
MLEIGKTFGVLLLAGSVIAGTSLHAEEQFGTMEGISFFYPDDFACGQNVIVKLRADSAAPFTNGELMNKVASQLAGAMAFDCADAENIKMDGFVAEELIYSAITSKGSDWAVLVRMAPENVQTGSRKNDTDHATSTGGVLPTLPSAEDTPVDAQSTTTQQTGSDNQAMDRLRSIGQQGNEPPSGDGLENIDYSFFNQPELIEAFHSGDLDAIDRSNNSVFFYINGFNKFFGNTVNFIDQSCVRLYDATLDKSTLKVMYGNIAGGGSVEEQGAQTLQQMLDMFVNMRNSGVDGMIDQFGAVDVLLQQGEKDAAILAGEYSCKSEFAKRTYFNMAAFANRTAPKMSPSVIRRKKIEAAQVSMTKRCQDRFANNEFCGCLVEGMQSMEISVEAWESAGTDLANLAFIAADPMVGRKLVRTCSQ